MGVLIKFICNFYYFDKWLLKEIFFVICYIIYIVVLYKIYKIEIGISLIVIIKRYIIDRYNILGIYWFYLFEIYNRLVYIYVVIYIIILYNRYFYKFLVWSFFWYLL